jgi:hypothetical protein
MIFALRKYVLLQLYSVREWEPLWQCTWLTRDFFMERAKKFLLASPLPHHTPPPPPLFKVDGDIDSELRNSSIINFVSINFVFKFKLVGFIIWHLYPNRHINNLTKVSGSLLIFTVPPHPPDPPGSYQVRNWPTTTSSPWRTPRSHATVDQGDAGRQWIN